MKEFKSQRDIVLKEKHGFSDPRACEAVEKTDRYLIAWVKKMGIHNLTRPGMREHFERKIAFHNKFDEINPGVR